MDAYAIADDIFMNPNLATVGDRLIAFSDAAMKEKNRKRPLDCLYRSILSYFNIFITIEKKEEGHFDFASGLAACGVYLALMLSSIHTSPVKTLKSIRELGAELSDTFCEPVGKAISEEDVHSIMDYLDFTYNAKKAIFGGSSSTILLLPCTDRQFNSECLALENPMTGEVRVKLFLYHLNESGVRSDTDPRYVFCHELGHALHTKYINTAMVKVPDELLDILELCFPLIKSLDETTQNDILADMLAVGMMYKSPFKEADPFHQIDGVIKEAMSKIVGAMCESILVRGR